jgi:hypothetical protein
MAEYFVNDVAQPTGEHEVHASGCHKMPENKTALGNFSDCQPAVQAASAIYADVDGCAICSTACHSK